MLQYCVHGLSTDNNVTCQSWREDTNKTPGLAMKKNSFTMPATYSKLGEDGTSHVKDGSISRTLSLDGDIVASTPSPTTPALDETMICRRSHSISAIFRGTPTPPLYRRPDFKIDLPSKPAFGPRKETQGNLLARIIHSNVPV